jgi:tRNA threonylcarbamoyladenosine biosynthesis protein TsaE
VTIDTVHRASMPERRSKNPEETRLLARELSGGLSASQVIALRGDLGAGKTEFVKGLAEGLGYPRDVTSPTFTLIHEYVGGRLPLYHMDLYRLESERELDELGLDDYLFGDGICAIEWAEKFPERFSERAIWIELLLGPGNERIIRW